MPSMDLIGIDLGGTNVRAARVSASPSTSSEPAGGVPGIQGEVLTAAIPAQGSMEEVLDVVYGLIDRLDVASVDGIGVGAPSVVDVDQGIVYDVQNIPSWREVPLKALLESRYDAPAFVNNDANCFAAGEYFFGKGRGCRSMVGLILGTGFAGGIVIDGRLYSGRSCGAGEFGMMSYRDSIYEYFCSGQFFQRTFGETGAELYQKARRGDAHAIGAFEAFGNHVGEGIKAVLYAYDPECIVLGGGVRKAYALFQESMWERIRTFTYGLAVERLRIEVSALEHGAILGAAALALDAGVVGRKPQHEMSTASHPEN